MTITAKFDSNCTACGGRITVGQRCNWQRGVKGVTHVTVNDCAQSKAERAAAPAPAPKPVMTANAKPFADFLRGARDRGLKFPKVAFLGPNGGELKMTLAGPNSKNPGAVFVYENGDYKGSIAADGTVRGWLSGRADLLATIASIATDPAAAAAAYGRLKGNCSFCLASLSDDRTGSSLEVGYGPICAKRYGLPHAPKGKDRKAIVLPVADEPADLDDYARYVGREPETAEPIEAAGS